VAKHGGLLSVFCSTKKKTLKILIFSGIYAALAPQAMRRYHGDIMKEKVKGQITRLSKDAHFDQLVLRTIGIKEKSDRSLQ
jgi:hypothetical protein